jgi:osmoprotectant transport system permease protein
MDLDIGLKYQALAEEQIDVMVVFTTDGQLSAADAVILEDDRGFFPSYLCGNVVRSQVLDEHPELRDVLAKLDDTITDADMAQMNYEVESESRTPEDVAREYLQERGLLS